MKKRILSLLLAALCCVALLPAALPVSAADAEAPTAADLVVKDGLLAEFRYGDSVALVTRGATWTSTDGQYTATMSGIYDGASYDIHWQKDANGAPFTLGGWAWAHSISLPDAIGAGKDTLMLETTFLAYGAQTDGEGNQVAAEQSNSWSDYSTLGACTFQLYGARFSHFNYGHKFASMSNWLCYSWSPLTEGTLGSTTWQKVYLFGTAETGVTGKADTLYLSRQYLRTEGEKDIMQVSVSTSLAGSTVENTTVPQAADNSKNAPEGATGLITLFRGLHAKVYFIRLYDRILTDAEKARNHFADVAAVQGLNLTGIDKIADKSALFASFAGYTVEDTDKKAEMQEKIDVAVQTAENLANLNVTAMTYDGLSARLVDNSGIRSEWSVDNAAIRALESQGYNVSYGAIMGLVDKGYASSSALTVEDGAGKKTVTVYTTKNTGSNIFLSVAEDKNTFAYTTVFADEDVSAANYQSKLVYRGFVTVEKDGQSRTFYTDMAGETFSADGVSCYEVAQVFLAKEAYATNAALLKVKQTVDGE